MIKFICTLLISQFIAVYAFSQNLENYLTTDTIYTLKKAIPCKITAITATELTFIVESNPIDYKVILLDKVIKYVKKQEDSTFESDTIIYNNFINNDSQIIKDNFYSPIHLTIIDSINKTVLENANYISIGLGGGGLQSKGGGYGVFADYTFLHKSHLISFSINHLTNGYSPGWNSPQYTSNYFGLLFGESYRRKNFLTSLSIGISNSELYCYDPNINAYQGAAIGAGKNYKRNGIAFPLQFKIQVLANNIIGFGYTYTYEMASKYSAQFHDFSIIFGQWNKIKQRRKHK